MKHIITLLFCLFAINLAFSHSPIQEQKQTLSQQEWLTLKPREIAKRTGQKMGFFQRMAIRMVQKKVRKAKEKPRTFAGKWSMRLYPAPVVLGLIGTVLTLITGAFNPVIYLVFIGGLLGFASLILGIIGLGKGDFRGKEGWKIVGPAIAGVLGVFAVLSAWVGATLLWAW